MQLGIFGKYLTLWVALCIAAGVVIGELWPAFPDALSRFTYSQVSVPVAVLITASLGMVGMVAVFFIYPITHKSGTTERESADP